MLGNIFKKLECMDGFGHLEVGRLIIGNMHSEPTNWKLDHWNNWISCATCTCTKTETELRQQRSWAKGA